MLQCVTWWINEIWNGIVMIVIPKNLLMVHFSGLNLSRLARGESCWHVSSRFLQPFEEHETSGQGFYHSKEPRIEMSVRAYMKRYEVLTCNAATLENSHLSGVLQVFCFAAVGSITPTWTFKGHGDLLEMDGIEEKVHDVLKPLEGHLRPTDPRDQCWCFDGDRSATIGHLESLDTRKIALESSEKYDDMELYGELGIKATKKWGMVVMQQSGCWLADPPWDRPLLGIQTVELIATSGCWTETQPSFERALMRHQRDCHETCRNSLQLPTTKQQKTINKEYLFNTRDQYMGELLSTIRRDSLSLVLELGDMSQGPFLMNDVFPARFQQISR